MNIDDLLEEFKDEKNNHKGAVHHQGHGIVKYQYEEDGWGSYSPTAKPTAAAGSMAN